MRFKLYVAISWRQQINKVDYIEMFCRFTFDGLHDAKFCMMYVYYILRARDNSKYFLLLPEINAMMRGRFELCQNKTYMHKGGNCAAILTFSFFSQIPWCSIWYIHTHTASSSVSTFDVYVQFATLYTSWAAGEYICEKQASDKALEEMTIG